VGAPNDFPRIAMIIDVASPSERFVADAQIALGGSLAQRTQISSCAINAPQSERGHIGADQDEVSAQLLHQVEFALGPIKGLAALRLRETLKIAEWLKQGYGQAEILNH